MSKGVPYRLNIYGSEVGVVSVLFFPPAIDFLTPGRAGDTQLLISALYTLTRTLIASSSFPGCIDIQIM